MASKECEKIAGPFLYRSITLGDKGNEKTLTRTEALIKRLLKKGNLIHDFTREIVIEDWGTEVENVRSTPGYPLTVRNRGSKLMTCAKLVSILQNVRGLESFRLGLPLVADFNG
jgi:hypothetical protein